MSMPELDSNSEPTPLRVVTRPQGGDAGAATDLHPQIVSEFDAFKSAMRRDAWAYLCQARESYEQADRAEMTALKLRSEGRVQEGQAGALLERLGESLESLVQLMAKK